MDAQTVQNFFNERADGWDAYCHHDAQRLARILQEAQLAPGLRILDAACGTGVLFAPLLQSCPAQLVGLDISEKMIAVAQQKYAAPNLCTLAQDLYTYTGTGFDRVILYSAYPHFADKQALAQKLYEVLAPGGRFVVAHSESRHAINGHHTGPAVCAVSSHLHSAAAECRWFESLFTVDVCVDTDEVYIFSGIK